MPVNQFSSISFPDHKITIRTCYVILASFDVLTKPQSKPLATNYMTIEDEPYTVKCHIKRATPSYTISAAEGLLAWDDLVTLDRMEFWYESEDRKKVKPKHLDILPNEYVEMLVAPKKYIRRGRRGQAEQSRIDRLERQLTRVEEIKVDDDDDIPVNERIVFALFTLIRMNEIGQPVLDDTPRVWEATSVERKLSKKEVWELVLSQSR